MALPPRATAHLIATGAMDEQHATRRPRPRHCARCGLAVIAAITDAGYTVACWPTPTTAWGELDAKLRGLPTYTHRPDDGLYYRDDFRIAGNNTDRVQVLVAHVCGDPTPEANPAHQRTVTRREAASVPPF